MMIFDPYNDRMARDIRNSLSSAFVNELTGDGNNALAAVAHDWLEKAPEPVYQAYIKDRLATYHQTIDQIKTEPASDPRYQSIYLWNLGLFFEVHELLETIWLHSSEPERSALKGWIQAAGVYVHFQRGQEAVAQSLAKRAATHLRNGRNCLAFIANLDEFIKAVANPTAVAPQLFPTR